MTALFLALQMQQEKPLSRCHVRFFEEAPFSDSCTCFALRTLSTKFVADIFPRPPCHCCVTSECRCCVFNRSPFHSRLKRTVRTLRILISTCKWLIVGTIYTDGFESCGIIQFSMGSPHKWSRISTSFKVSPRFQSLSLDPQV